MRCCCRAARRSACRSSTAAACATTWPAATPTYDLAVANYNQSLVGALREVADAVHSARSLDAQIVSATQARDAAQAAWDIATSRYKAGLGTQLDVLAAQRPLLESDRQLTVLRAQRLAASIDLDRALGGGLVLPTPNSDSKSDIAKASTP